MPHGGGGAALLAIIALMLVVVVVGAIQASRAAEAHDGLRHMVQEGGQLVAVDGALLMYVVDVEDELHLDHVTAAVAATVASVAAQINRGCDWKGEQSRHSHDALFTISTTV